MEMVRLGKIWFGQGGQPCPTQPRRRVPDGHVTVPRKMVGYLVETSFWIWFGKALLTTKSPHFHIEDDPRRYRLVVLLGTSSLLKHIEYIHVREFLHLFLNSFSPEVIAIGFIQL